MSAENGIGTSGHLYAVEGGSPPPAEKLPTGGRLYAADSAQGVVWPPEVDKDAEEPGEPRKQRNWPEIRSTGLELAGIGSFSAGFGWFSPGLGLIFGGIGLIVVGFTLGRPPIRDTDST